MIIGKGPKDLKDPMYKSYAGGSGKEDIDLQNAGRHYTLDYMYMDAHFLDNIGIYEYLPMWLLTCEVKKDDIDIIHTLATNIQYPSENEVSVKPNSKVNVIDIKEFE